MLFYLLIIPLFRIGNEVTAYDLAIHPFQSVGISFFHRLDGFVKTHFFIAVESCTKTGACSFKLNKRPHGEVELVRYTVLFSQSVYLVRNAQQSRI